MSNHLYDFESFEHMRFLEIGLVQFSIVLEPPDKLSLVLDDAIIDVVREYVVQHQ